MPCDWWTRIGGLGSNLFLVVGWLSTYLIVKKKHTVVSFSRTVVLQSRIHKIDFKGAVSIIYIILSRLIDSIQCSHSGILIQES